ncbi:hypothetical protein [Colwellia sp. RSH04]|uniref:hypothetical protein n=1 Tax=Colwellia sp. RSH04 TaxID=2305464 RepID=UPI000E56A740|nr:hypothetical protein [Colwellia sp. RSH04]RHW76488.1 hypothetical protein D1094_09275 [Colwellia sp. RSH04]
MDTTFVAIIFTVFCGIPCMVIGYMIGMKQKRSLLSSWDDDSFSDPEQVGRIMGGSLFLMGLILLVFSIGVIVSLITIPEACIALCVSISLPFIAGLLSNLKYGK